MAAVDHERMWRVLRRFADTLVQRYELGEVLEQLGSDVVEVLGVAGAGVMVAGDDGALHLASLSDERMQALESLQIALDEGPCLLAYRTGTQVLAPDLDADARFPRFAERAVEAGMRAVYSFPMRVADTVCGALNFYSTEVAGSRQLTREWIEGGQTLADVATAYLVNARESERQRLLSSQLQQALDARVVIEQAKGFLMAHGSLPARQAFEALRGYSRARRRAVRDVAADVVAGTVEPGDVIGR